MDKKRLILFTGLFIVIISSLMVWGVSSGILNDTGDSGAISITSPTEDQIIYGADSASSVTLTASLVAGNSTNNLTWFLGGDIALVTTNTTNSTANGAVAVPISLGDGERTITINASNSAISAWSATAGPFVANITGPNVTVVQNLNTTGVSVTTPLTKANISSLFNIQGIVLARNLTTNVTYYLTGNGSTTTLTSVHGINSLNVSNFDSTTLNDGNYTLWINATNDSKRINPGVVLKGFEVIVDNTPPILTITLSDSDDKVYTRSEQKVTCSSTDSGSTVNGRLTVELHKPNGATVTKNLNSGDTVTFKNDDTAKSGEYTVKCKATDFASNEGLSTKTFDVRVRSSGSPSGGTDGPSADYSLEERDTTVASGREGSSKTFTLDGTTTHTIEFLTVTDTSATLKISSTPQEFTLNIGASQDVDLNDDGKLDVKITLDNIQTGRASISLDKLEGAADITEPSTEEVERQEAERRAEEERKAKEQAAASTTTIVIIIVIIIVIVGGYFLWKKGGKGKGKKGHIKFSRAELRSK